MLPCRSPDAVRLRRTQLGNLFMGIPLYSSMNCLSRRGLSHSLSPSGCQYTRPRHFVLPALQCPCALTSDHLSATRPCCNRAVAQATEEISAIHSSEKPFAPFLLFIGSLNSPALCGEICFYVRCWKRRRRPRSPIQLVICASFMLATTLGQV